MLRKVVRSVSRGRERPPSPEFVSRDAKKHETLQRTNSGNGVSMTRDQYLAPPAGEPGHILPFYLDTSLEALNLESIIQPTLGRMRPMLHNAEKILPALPDLPAHNRLGLLTVPKQSHQPPSMKAAHDKVLIKDVAPTIVVSPAEQSSSSSSRSSEHNPFEHEFGSVASLNITPLPPRPQLQRKAVSYRTQRELPLRVQAVRRSHQEMYARQILEQSSLRRPVQTRRASESEMPKRPNPQPIQSSTTNRSQSLANIFEQTEPLRPRSRSQSRSPSRARHERMPSGPHRQRAVVQEDFYLKAAFADWSFD